MALTEQQKNYLAQELSKKRNQMGDEAFTKYLSKLEAGRTQIKQTPQPTGISPEPEQPSFSKRAASVLDTVFGGGKIGEAIGTAAAKSGLTGLSPEQRQFVSDGPSAKQVAADVGRTALTFAPVGRVGSGLATGFKAARIPAAKTLGTLGAGAGAGYAFDVTENARQGNDSARPGAGTLIGAGLPAAFIASKGLAKVTPKLLTYTSDVPEKAFDELIKRRGPVTQAIKSGTTAEDALSSTQAAVRGLRKSMSQQWDDASKEIISEFQGKRIGLNSKEVRLLEKVADDFPLDVPDNLENLSVKESMELLRKVNELYSKKAVRESAQGIAARQLKDTLKTKVVANFGGKNGSVAKLYNNYAAKKDVFDAANDIVKAYSKNKPIQQSTALGRLKALFNENKSAYLDAILELEQATGRDLMSKITAVQFADKMPKGTTAITTSGTLQQTKGILDKALDLLILPLSSPRSAAWIARNMSRLQNVNVSTPGDRVFRGAIGDAIENSAARPSAGMSVQSTAGKALRQIDYVDPTGSKRSIRLPIDEAKEFLAWLDSRGIKFDITTVSKQK